MRFTDFVKVPDIVIMPKKPDYFRAESPLSDRGERYCRCVMHVAADQPDWCLEEGFPRTSRRGETCYNPYAVCTQSIGRKGLVECFLNYNLDAPIPERELEALIFLKRKRLRQHDLPETIRGLKQLQKKLSKQKP